MTTGTVNKATAQGIVDPEELRILEMMSGIKDASEVEPADKVVHRGDDQNPAPMVRTPTTSAGYVYLLRNSDGKMVLINKNQLMERFKQKLPDGRPAWLTPNTVWQGKKREPAYWCPLSAHHPDRTQMDELNLEVCERRGKLMSQTALRRHLIKKHKDSWEAIQEHQREIKEQSRDKHQETLAKGIEKALKGK